MSLVRSRVVFGLFLLSKHRRAASFAAFSTPKSTCVRSRFKISPLYMSSGFSFDDGSQVLVSVQRPLGIVLEQEAEGDPITVASVYSSGSAARAGVQLGDVLVAVQNASVKGESLEYALDFIGRVPRVVSLRFVRPSFVRLPDGAELPYETQPAPLELLVGHGLGSDPQTKSHYNDIATVILRDALARMPDGNGKAVFYTARGHGTSRVWENSSAECFGWPSLGQDMMDVAVGCGLTDRFVVAGQSMGAASAIYMAMSHPDVLKGMILMRPPRAWKMRSADGYLQHADVLERSGNPSHVVLRGASKTNLPSDKEAYHCVSCPVLILCHGKDEDHPVETGRALSELFENSCLHVTEDEEAARRDWPAIIAEWTVECGLVNQ